MRTEKEIKKLVDEERNNGNHYYLYTAMRNIAKKLGLSESTINQQYYKKKVDSEKNKKFQNMADEIIDWGIVREDHIPEFIKDTEKLIIKKLKVAYKMGKDSQSHGKTRSEK